MALLEMCVYFWQGSSVLPYPRDGEVRGVEGVMGPNRSRRWGVFDAIARCRDGRGTGRGGLAEAAQLPGTRQPRAERFCWDGERGGSPVWG